jgi:cyclic pyranopterin phosphate synthase
MAAVTQRILAVSGVKNAGKTTLIEALIPLLTGCGLRVATVKHDGHRFGADRPGTDSFRFFEAGAVASAVFDGEKFQLVRRAEVTERELIALCPDADLVLLEGFKWADCPRIEIVPAGAQPVCDSATLLAIVTDGDAAIPGLPKLRRDETERLADLIWNWWREQTMEQNLTHLDAHGNAVMVDVTEKAETKRIATARGRIRMQPETLSLLRVGALPKGDVLAVARVAGILAAKRTSELIPLCHPLRLGKVNVDFSLLEETGEIEAICTVALRGQTGVEMEALTGVSMALLTIYDMCKAVDKNMELSGIRLTYKRGGKSGEFVREPEESNP